MTAGMFLAAALVIALILFQNQATIDTARARSATLSQQNRDLTDQLGEASSRYDRLFEEYKSLYDQSQKEGVEPLTTDPSDVPSAATSSTSGTPGATGATGPPGKDGADGADGADGRDGRNGDDGSAGTAGSTGASGDMGVPGQAGAPGVDGATGTQGPAGPSGTTGAAGKDGADGKNGRGVASVTCVLTVAGTAFRFTFTDATTSDVSGACTPTPAGEPTDAPSG
ncbi:collagen-like protein [Curtobacterium flaccumfaciens]|nr:collagen-like protein [Curtobacterium flaccumfaciens]